MSKPNMVQVKGGQVQLSAARASGALTLDVAGDDLWAASGRLDFGSARALWLCAERLFGAGVRLARGVLSPDAWTSDTAERGDGDPALVSGWLLDGPAARLRIQADGEDPAKLELEVGPNSITVSMDGYIDSTQLQTAGALLRLVGEAWQVHGTPSVAMLETWADGVGPALRLGDGDTVEYLSNGKRSAPPDVGTVTTEGGGMVVTWQTGEVDEIDPETGELLTIDGTVALVERAK